MYENFKDFNLTNNALNEFFFTLLGTGKVDSSGKINKDEGQTAFDDYLDFKNAQSDKDQDLIKLDYLKKGYPTTRGQLGIYVYTLSKEESVVVDIPAKMIYSTVFVEIGLKEEQSAYMWKYQDALLNFLMAYEWGLATVSIGVKTYTKDGQDGGNYSVFEIGFVLQYLTDSD